MAHALPQALETFLAGRNAPVEFRQLLHDCNITDFNMLANMAPTQDDLKTKTNVFALPLAVQGLADDGNIRPADEAAMPLRHAALSICTRVRAIWTDAWAVANSSTAAPGLVREPDSTADLEIDPTVYEVIVNCFRNGTDAAHPGYGFTYSPEERGHDRLTSVLHRQISNGYLRTTDLTKVYAQTDNPKIIEIMRKEKLASSFIATVGEVRRRLEILLNSIGLVGAFRNAAGERFVELQALREYLD